MNIYILKTIKARLIKFDDNMPFDCLQVKFVQELSHAHLRLHKPRKCSCKRTSQRLKLY